MATPLIHRPESNGASTQTVQAMTPGQAEYALPVTGSAFGVQVAAMLGVLTGVWVALSPWFITLQQGGTNANIVDLISGLAVAGVGVLALASARGFAGLQLGSALLGVWLIIAGPILSQTHVVTDAMFWSNSWVGGLLIAFAAIGLGTVALRRPARR